jgi:hypothetical protein
MLLLSPLSSTETSGKCRDVYVSRNREPDTLALSKVGGGVVHSPSALILFLPVGRYGSPLTGISSRLL